MLYTWLGMVLSYFHISVLKLTTIKCMRQVKVQLVDMETKTPLPQSSTERICHVVKEEGSWTLYVQHEFGGRKSQAILAKAVNEIMDNCFEGIGELSDMLSCDTPSQIAEVLNDHNVTIDYHEDSEELGQPVPNVYHFLMIQNPLCQFEEGTRVAYGVDQVGGRDWREDDEEEESTMYRLAKILTRANTTNKEAAEYDFEAQYTIDLGNKTDATTVSALDIYSYHQDDLGNLISLDNDAANDVHVNVDEEKPRIGRALNLAKNLDSILQRRKVLRRLFLHWLRCKDPKAAAELTAFIESEVIRLKVLRKEERRYLSYWRSRGRRERTTFVSYNHWTYSDSTSSYDSDYHGSRMYSFSDAEEYVNPDEKEAKRWIQQSKADLSVAKFLCNESYSQVCYLSQQCVEKCLKGVLYAKCGIPWQVLRTHDIQRLASSVRHLEGVPGEIDRCGTVAYYYLSTRYPDNQPKYRVPAEQFSEDQAKDALKDAETVFTALEKFAFDD